MSCSGLRGIRLAGTSKSTPQKSSGSGLDRKKLREKIENDTRPPVGTSDVLGTPFRVDNYGADRNAFDWVGLAPVHLLGGKLDQDTKSEIAKARKGPVT